MKEHNSSFTHLSWLKCRLCTKFYMQINISLFVELNLSVAILSCEFGLITSELCEATFFVFFFLGGPYKLDLGES